MGTPRQILFAQFKHCVIVFAPGTAWQQPYGSMYKFFHFGIAMFFSGALPVVFPICGLCFQFWWKQTQWYFCWFQTAQKILSQNHECMCSWLRPSKFLLIISFPLFTAQIIFLADISGQWIVPTEHNVHTATCRHWRKIYQCVWCLRFWSPFIQQTLDLKHWKTHAAGSLRCTEGDNRIFHRGWKGNAQRLFFDSKEPCFLSKMCESKGTLAVSW